jgi:hypothetical protein
MSRSVTSYRKTRPRSWASSLNGAVRIAVDHQDRSAGQQSQRVTTGEAAAVGVVGTLAAAVIGTSTVMVVAIAVASRLSERVHDALWGE